MTALPALIERIWDIPTQAEVKDAVESLSLKEHEVPEGFVSWNGSALVRVGERISALLRNAVTADEARAIAILLIDEASKADEARDEKAKQDAYERGPAVAGVTP